MISDSITAESVKYEHYKIFNIGCRRRLTDEFRDFSLLHFAIVAKPLPAVHLDVHSIAVVCVYCIQRVFAETGNTIRNTTVRHCTISAYCSFWNFVRAIFKYRPF